MAGAEGFPEHLEERLESIALAKPTTKTLRLEKASPTRTMEMNRAAFVFRFIRANIFLKARILLFYYFSGPAQNRKGDFQTMFFSFFQVDDEGDLLQG